MTDKTDKADKAEAKPVIRELIGTGVHTEFGEVLDDPANPMDLSTMPDLVTYTPGWSELRVARDRALAEVANGKARMRDVPTLPVNVRLSRRTRANGAPDASKMIAASNRGYRVVTKADIGQPWMREMPDGATVLADGSIAKGDCVYTVCTAQQAAQNAHRKQVQTMARLSAGQETASRAGVDYTSRLGETIGAPPSRVNVR